MWYYRKIDPLAAVAGKKYVSFVGAGGKTSYAEYIAARAVEKRTRVIITTTTKIWAREPFATLDRGPWQGRNDGQFLRVGKSVENGKLTGLTPDDVKTVGKDYDLVLIEADGSRSMPLKYPASFEPVIPGFTDLTVVVAGLDALSGAIADKVFRWKLLAEKAGVSPGGRVTSDVFLGLFGKDGLLKGVNTANCLVVLNKYDACPEREIVPELARGVSERAGGAPVIVASVRHGIFYEVCRQQPGASRARPGG
jgi:probable selenium-dependent hydroxylase accessory protein YqeC